MADYSINESTIITRNLDIITANIDDETVMMNIDSGEYHGLNNTASQIWDLLEQPLTFAELIELLLNTYELKREHCLQDTQLFLHQMIECKLLKLG
jgi:hypothetical protein